MVSKCRLLFIAWDAPHVTYLESLFVPIFQKLRQRNSIQIHVVQFTWADDRRTKQVAEVCQRHGIPYTFRPVVTQPFIFGQLYTIIRGIFFIRQYLRNHGINVIMPRSTMPGLMTFFSSQKIPIVFDADGLPIEERVDFAGLSSKSIRFWLLKKIEGGILKRATVITSRTFRAINYLSESHVIPMSRFVRVINGRDEGVFQPCSLAERQSVRSKLGIPEGVPLIVYCGSIGPQYGIDEMLGLHSALNQDGQYWMLLLVTQPERLKSWQPLPDRVCVIKAMIAEVPMLLAASDIGLALRQPSFSMQGVAPIKIGEYLLCGLPVVATKGVGDIDAMLSDEELVLLVNFNDWKNELPQVVAWIRKSVGANVMDARTLGQNAFGLQASVKSYEEALRQWLV